MHGRHLTGILQEIRGDLLGVRCRLGKQDGFTLMELSIALVILGLVLALVVVNYANASRAMALKGAQRQVEAALNRALTASRQENVSYRLIFYPDASGSHPNSYEFLHNVKDELTGTWSLTPVDKSVSGEDVVEDGGHYYITVTNGAKIVSSSVITVDLVPRGTTLTVTPVTITLALGSSTAQVVLDSRGKVTVP